MSRGIYVALSGALAQTRALDTTANNLANASTDGFQRARALFREAAGPAVRDGETLRFAEQTNATPRDGVGPIRTTGRELDIALPGGAFLAVSTPTGERYTRAGALRITADGQLSTEQGHPVRDERGDAIRIDAGSPPAIASDGVVSQGDQVRGRLRIVTFERPGDLASEGATLLAATPSSGNATPTQAVITPRALEGSNVSVVGSMTELVSATRTFEAFERAIDVFREADRRVIRLPGSGT